MKRFDGKILFLVVLAGLLILAAFLYAPDSASTAAPGALKNPDGSVPQLDFSAQARQPGSQGRTGNPPGVDPALIQNFRQQARGAVSISAKGATGKAASVAAVKGGDLLPGQSYQAPRGKALGFFARYGELFGVQAPDSELVEVTASTDQLGATHYTYQQVYNGVPVFGGVLRAHLDANNNLTAVNGVFVPEIAVQTTPALSGQAAGQAAIAAVVANPPVDDSTDEVLSVSATDLQVSSSQLFVYQDGLLQGVSGPKYLVYQVEVTGGSGIREIVFVDAQSGKIVNRYSAVQSALFRRLFEMNTSTQVWQEGDPFPGSLNQDQQNIVLGSGETYHLFKNAFGRDSYDAAGAEMQSVNNDPRISCPNANWNGLTTNYCNGVTGDDTVAHEWGHAYTEYTHNLIYQWQSGALNESYSDIWGEVVDLINNRGTDLPGPVRTEEVCSIFTTPVPLLRVNAPPSIAGDYAAGAASFGPSLTAAGVTGDIVLADDGTGTTTDACEALVNGSAIAGNIALVDRGSCNFTVKVKNAQNAGATGVIVADNVPGPVSGMGGSDSTITIPSLRVTLDTGNLIKSELAYPPNATLTVVGGAAPEASYRWLSGEDDPAFGSAIRDMWAPTCKSDPGKVTDAEYFCATSDGGGVHTNSGVPNHGFALLVDGGTYNGHTVNAIGLTKAAHLYWRAESVYQTPTSNFSDHADALEMACTDLIGMPLEGLSTSSTPAGPSGESFTTADCTAVHEMTEAVELRTDPSAQCNFTELLAKNPPALCADTPGGPSPVFGDGFETGLGSWALTNQGVFSGWPGYDWAQAVSLPGGRAGAAAFGIDPRDAGNCDGGAGDVSGFMSMESPVIQIPAGSQLNQTRLAYDHYVATEAGWDGGNLKISINGLPFQVVPASAYTYNPYNANLNTAAAGNTNPLAGQPGFTGTDGGSLFGSWGQSQIDLVALGVQPGDSIQLRYDMGMDGCTGNDGWYVDDVNVYTCQNPSAPTISIQAGGTCNTEKSATLLLNVGDADTSVDDLAITASSSNQSLVPDANLVLGGSGSNRTLTVTAANRMSGSAIITVTVSDGVNTTAIIVQVLVGTNMKDSLNGSGGPDLIFSLNGKDTIYAGAGNDMVCGWNGESTIYGGSGDDTLYGANGDDMLYGEDGNDVLSGGRGADFFSGGPGTDTALDFTPSDGDTTDGSIP